MNLVDPDLGRSLKSGYTFSFEPLDSGHFYLNADPVKPGNTGVRHFYVDDTGVIRFNAEGTATPQGTPLE